MDFSKIGKEDNFIYIEQLLQNYRYETSHSYVLIELAQSQKRIVITAKVIFCIKTYQNVSSLEVLKHDRQFSREFRLKLLSWEIIPQLI